jgi:hypothetical protein
VVFIMPAPIVSGWGGTTPPSLASPLLLRLALHLDDVLPRDRVIPSRLVSSCSGRGPLPSLQTRTIVIQLEGES